MANPKIHPNLLIDRLLTVFRTLGYDGASMTELAAATGLKKASLYHRFPEGKQAMAQAVLDHLAAWTKAYLTEVVQTSQPLETKLDTVFGNIRDLYHGGTVACVYRALSHGTAASLFEEAIAAQFREWMDGFARLAVEAGLEQKAAEQLGKDAVVRIQGVLILAQVFHQPELFEQTLVDIRSLLKQQ